MERDNLSTVSSLSTLTPPAATPAYLRIADHLRARIENAELSPGDALAPERELCTAYSVSRMTVRKALNVLEGEGLILRDATRGTFVARPRLTLRIGSFSQEVARGGGQADAELVWAREQEAGPIAARMLGCETSDSVYVLQRLRRWDSEPVAVETTYYLASRVPGFLDGDLHGSLWDRLPEYGIVLCRTTATVEVVSLDATAGPLLETRQGAAGLHLTRQTYDGDGQIIEYAQDVYRADRVALKIERSVD